MRRIQLSIDETLDAAVTAEAARRGIPRRRSSVGVTAPPEDPWEAMIGWLDDDPVDDADEVVYAPKR